MLRLLCSLLLLVPLVAMGQQVPQPDAPVAESDTTTEKPVVPKIKEKIEFRAVRFGTDIISLIRSSSETGFGGYELNSDVDIGRYYLTLDVGHQKRDYDVNTGGTYSVSGTYYRIGVDVNFLKKDPDRNMFFFGLRYGHSSFSETAQLDFKDPYYGAFIRTLSNPSVSAGWFEFASGIKIKVWKEFWMGYTARLKFLPTVNGADAMKAYEIPGFGIASETFYWGFNYQVFYRIPWKRPGISVTSEK